MLGKKTRDLDALLGDLPDRNKLGLCLTGSNSHGAANCAAEATHTCVTSVPTSQILVSFTLRPAVIKLQAILRQVALMNPTWPLILQSQGYSTYVLLSSTSPKFQSILLYQKQFWGYRPF